MSERRVELEAEAIGKSSVRRVERVPVNIVLPTRGRTYVRGAR